MREMNERDERDERNERMRENNNYLDNYIFKLKIN